jgi:hypothetical protein
MSITASMSAVEPPHKGHLSLESCPPRRDGQLAAAIHAGEARGLGVWRVPVVGGYLPVPRLDAVPVTQHGRSVLQAVGEVAFRRELAARGGRIALDGEVVALLGGRPLLPLRMLPPRLLDAISAPTPQTAIAAGARALADAPCRRLAAAALHDLGGLSYAQVAAELLIAGADASGSAKRDIRAGRAMWQAVPGGWPWWIVPGPLPRDWGRDARIAAAWRAWCDGALSGDA